MVLFVSSVFHIRVNMGSGLVSKVEAILSVSTKYSYVGLIINSKR